MNINDMIPDFYLMVGIIYSSHNDQRTVLLDDAYGFDDTYYCNINGLSMQWAHRFTTICYHTSRLLFGIRCLH